MNVAALPSHIRQSLEAQDDRASLLEQWSMPEEQALANEWRHGRASLAAGKSIAATIDRTAPESR